MTTMDCAAFVELVTAYLDGALDRPTHTRFEEHLAECPGCDRYLDQMRATIAHLGHLPPESLAPRVRGDLLDAFRDWSAP